MTDKTHTKQKNKFTSCLTLFFFLFVLPFLIFFDPGSNTGIDRRLNFQAKRRFGYIRYKLFLYYLDNGHFPEKIDKLVDKKYLHAFKPVKRITIEYSTDKSMQTFNLICRSDGVTNDNEYQHNKVYDPYMKFLTEKTRKIPEIKYISIGPHYTNPLDCNVYLFDISEIAQKRTMNKLELIRKRFQDEFKTIDIKFHHQEYNYHNTKEFDFN